MDINEILRHPKLISTDTRTIEKGGIFIAIKGNKFDGHDFVEEAFKKGARAAIVSRVPKRASCKHRLIRLKDTVKTLGDIANMHRLKFDIPIIAITGSNGKTTAKDMVVHILSERYNVLKNEASKNNLIGLPLALLQLAEKHDIAVLEMGMNHLGEIDRLSEIAKPQIGVITNIGPTHLEFLGMLKNVLLAKSELLKRLPKGGLAILNKDDIYLRNIREIAVRKIYFGIEKDALFKARNLVYRENKWHFAVGQEENFELGLLGKHNIYNALIGVAVARQFGIDFSFIKERIKSFRQTCPMRLEFKDIRGIEILDDSYNSNPKSLECAIEALAKYNSCGKKIVVSGDMLELGKKARFMHQAIGKIIASSPIDILITLGRLSKFMNKGAKDCGMDNLYHAESHREAANLLRKFVAPGDVVLVKGSRATEMERVIEEFKKV